MLTENNKMRLGTFKVLHNDLHQKTEQVLKVMEGMLIVDVHHNFLSYEYTALSENFSLIEAGRNPLPYKYRFDAKGRIIWDIWDTGE